MGLTSSGRFFLPDSSVTVLIPNFNGAKFLATAIGSVLAQNVPINILVVDNGSTDNSLEVITSFKKSNRNFDFVIETKIGVAHALQTGLLHISTPFVARLDSDDVMSEDRLTKQLNYLANNPECVLVGSQLIYIDEFGGKIGESKYPNGEDIRRELASSNPIAHPSVTFRTASALNVGGYRAEFEGAEDLDLWLRLGSVGQIAVLNEPLTFYRIHENQVSRRNLYFAELKVRRNFFSENKMRTYLGSVPAIKRMLLTLILAISFGKLKKLKNILRSLRST